MKRLMSCTAVALLLATGVAFAAEDAAQPNAAQSDQTQPNAAAQDQAAAPSEPMATSRSEEMAGSLVNGALPISGYYNQAVYDNRDNKIGDINDLLLDSDGKVSAAIIGVGGVLGVGERNVAVPFSLLKVADKEGSHYLVLEANKEALQTAPGYVYDSGKKVWLPATKQG